MTSKQLPLQSTCKNCGLVTFAVDRAFLMEALHDGMPLELVCINCKQIHRATYTERERLAIMLSHD